MRVSMVRIRDYLEKLRDEIIIDDISYEDSLKVSRAIRSREPRSIFFTRPFRDKDPLISNIYSTPGKVERLMGIVEGGLFNRMINAKKNLIKPLVKSNWDGEIFNPERISKIPVLKYYKGDAGKYVTSSVLVAKDPEDDVVNMSVHRLLLLDSDRFVIRLVEGRHLHQIFEKNSSRGKDTDVAVLIGNPAHIMLSASTQQPKEVSELNYAGALNNSPLEVFYPDGLDLPVPLESEYVFQGRIRSDLSAREWMTDILCIYDKPRDQPVLEVERVYIKDNPVYHAIIPGGLEHKMLMGYPAEVKIREKLIENGVDVKDLWLSSGSGGWLHCFVSISKKSDKEPGEIILLVMEAHRSVKGVIVVDEDIDPRSYEDIDFALATRFQDRSKFYFFEKTRGSSLDPSSDQVNLLTSKWGLDLTLPMSVDKKRFLRSRM
ncbi:MAG: UbiD family decarboxylase [Thermoproteota archaeon]